MIISYMMKKIHYKQNMIIISLIKGFYMKKIYLYSSLIIVIISSLIFSGCIIFHEISYDVKLDTPTSGTAVITAYDMRSDAKSKADLEKDKKNLFQHMLKSNEFIQEQKQSGKYIIDRKLYVEDGKLIGQGSYKFDDYRRC